MESAGLHAEPGQQSLSVGRTRFRTGRKTDSKPAPADGSDSRRDRPGKSQSAASAARARRNSDRANAGRNQSRARRTLAAARPGAANEKRTGSIAGKNRGCAGGLQEMASERSAATLRRQFSPWRGEVSEEAPLRARVEHADGRNHEACSERFATNANRDL